MGEALRGTRLGAVSYESDLGVDFAPRQLVPYDCPAGHAFAVPMAMRAEIPATWECRVCAATARRRDGASAEERPARKIRTPWDMLMERRSVDDLEALLVERLEVLRSRGGVSVAEHRDHRDQRRSA